MTLSPDHLQQLTDGSGIAREVIDERGYRTCTGYSELKSLAIPLRRDTDTHGLLIPLYTTEGKGAQTYIAKEDRSVPLMVYRPDTPEIDAEGRERKYLYPGGQRTRLDCHPRCFPMLSDPTKPLWITEGQKKGDSLVTRGQCSLALLGVWNWRGRNDKGGTMALPDWQSVALNNRDIRIVFDSDVVEKPQVRQALEALAQFLSAKQATVHVAYLPSAVGAMVGVDDFLLTPPLRTWNGSSKPHGRPQKPQRASRHSSTPRTVSRDRFSLILWKSCYMTLNGRGSSAIMRFLGSSRSTPRRPALFSISPGRHVRSKSTMSPKSRDGFRTPTTSVRQPRWCLRRSSLSRIVIRTIRCVTISRALFGMGPSAWIPG